MYIDRGRMKNVWTCLKEEEDDDDDDDDSSAAMI